MARTELYKSVTFNDMVTEELVSARLKHPSKTNSHHEAYSVILEELDEYWDEVKKNGKERNELNMLIELVQTAAMCRKAAEDLLNIPNGD